ncbi:MAG: MFS transporter [Clostridia bacterium]|nr:MFS transporter [Clostridia bacterium]
MKTKLSPRFWSVLTLFGLIGQVAWVVENMYLNVFIYKMFNASAADISLMVAASAVAATLTTVLIGALSDKIGKRKLFICGGYILWGISIFGFVFIRTDLLGSWFPSVASAASLGASLVIALDCIMTFFGSSANDAAFNAWLTDSTDSTNRGAAEGINAMMPLVAILVVFGGFMAFDLEKAESWSVIFTVIGAVVTLIGIIGCFLIKEPPIQKSEQSYLSAVIHGFRPSTVKDNRSLYFYLFAFILFNISIQIFMPYLILYYEVSLKMTNYVFVMAPAIILASVVTAFWGKVYDKKQFDFSAAISLLWLSVGYVMLYLFRSTALVFVGSLLMMSGYLSGMAVFGAKIRDLIPEDRAGMFQGVRIFSQVLIPGMVGPFIGKTVLKNAEMIVNNDGTQSFIPNQNIFLAALIAVAVLAVLLLLIRPRKSPRLNHTLKTPFETDSKTDWQTEYPRPQLRRDSFFNLNGQWELSVEREGEETSLGEITVPFPPESRLSGIQRELKPGEKYRYTRLFSLPDGFQKERVLLHFGAVDQVAEVSINGHPVGVHHGGYTPFEWDITAFLSAGENRLEVLVTDTLDFDFPYGKQRRDRGGMWYTPVSGIWQTVWLESVPKRYISALKITSTLHSVTLQVTGGEPQKTLKIKGQDGDKVVDFTGDTVTVPIENPVWWSPENPHLYEFSLSSGEDVVDSYFALRTVSVEAKNGRAYLCLNGKPTFFHGLLDQGYFSDGIYTPATPDGYLFDILEMKKLGFNMLRKHIKVEPELFYYYCDKYGMIVFQDMVNSGRYHYLLDTVLPTVGLKKGITHSATDRRRELFEQTAAQTLDLLYNHPSVCYYTVFNEGWGQYDADRMYEKLKALDPTRVFDATSGWFTEKNSDVTSEHIYFKKIRLHTRPDRPAVLSEFGGYSCKVPEHSFNLDKTYGYRFFTTLADFEKALTDLYLHEVIPAIKDGLCAAVLTQVSDVEDETNGLVTYDRQVMKVQEQAMQEIKKRLFDQFDRQLAE